MNTKIKINKKCKGDRKKMIFFLVARKLNEKINKLITN